MARGTRHACRGVGCAWLDAPTYARAVDQAVLRSLVDDADPQRTTTHLSRPRTLSEPALTPDVVTDALPAALLALSGEPVAGKRYAQQVVPAKGKKPSPVVVRSRDRMCEHLEVEGRCAEAAGEVLVSAADARGIARTRALLARGPAVLLADEPTSELDHDNRERVVALLRGLADDGACVVVTTHDPEGADAADAVVALDR